MSKNIGFLVAVGVAILWLGRLQPRGSISFNVPPAFSNIGNGILGNYDPFA